MSKKISKLKAAQLKRRMVTDVPLTEEEFQFWKTLDDIDTILWILWCLYKYN